MKKRIHFSLLFAVFLCFLIFIPNAFATPMAGDTIELSWSGTFGHANGGGEFKAIVSRDGSEIDTFRTFCVETSEHISLGTEYTVGAISTTTQNTGIDLNPLTAYLYSMYRAGTLDELTLADSDNTTVFQYDDKDSANALQAAIWELQGQSYGAQNYLYHLAMGTTWTGLGNVRVMNIVDGLTAKQDQLTLVSEPATLLLSGLGLIFVGVFFRRKFIK